MRKRGRKIIAGILATAMVASVFAGCGGNSAGDDKKSGSAEKKQTFKILSIWNEDSTQGKIIKGICEDYKKEDPEFTYEYEYVASSDLSTKISALVASDDLPDLFAYSAGKPLQTLIKSEKVVNISEALQKLGEADTIMDGAKSSLTSLSDTKDLYDLPFGMNIEGFWYNKSVFSKAGVSEPKTWDEFLALCETLKGKGIQPLTTGGADKWPASRLINAYAYRSMGREAVKDASTGKKKFTDEGYVKAAQMLFEMSKKGYFGQGASTVDNTTAEGMMLNGQAAMVYDGSWITSSVADETKNPSGADNVGFFGVPVVNEAVSSADELPTNCGNVLCLSKKKYNENTAKWLKYFTTHVGDYAMSNFQTLTGFNYTANSDKLNSVTKLVIEKVNNEKNSTAWWEAYMDDQTKSTAQNNVQSVLNGEMNGETYCKSIQEAYDLSH